ncbi:MAG: hypothetical protein D6689_00650 [Deltaproteobacteria bacterium]|nr:MAG: hypothetical protein D6689_00650 [Deltaproteobacteria bacterium]
MSRSFLPPRPSDYHRPVFMQWVPEDAEVEAAEIALRHGKVPPDAAADAEPQAGTGAESPGASAGARSKTAAGDDAG